MLTVKRVFITPILIVLYLIVGVPLAARQFSHMVTVWLDDAFDWLADIADWDCRYWPLPRASDNPLPYEDDYSE